MQTLKSILNRLNNKGTILAIAGLVISLLVQFGVQIDSDKIMGIIQTMCAILIGLGVLNDPTNNTNAYIPGISDKLVEKPSKIEETQKTSDEVAAEKSTEVSNVKIPVEEVSDSIIEEVK